MSDTFSNADFSALSRVPRLMLGLDHSSLGNEVPEGFLELCNLFRLQLGNLSTTPEFREHGFVHMSPANTKVLFGTLTEIVCCLDVPTRGDVLDMITAGMANFGTEWPTSQEEDVLVFLKHVLFALSSKIEYPLSCDLYENPAPVTVKDVDEFFNLLQAFALVSELNEFKTSADVQYILGKLNEYRAKVKRWTVNHLVELQHILFEENVFALIVAGCTSGESFFGCKYLLSLLSTIAAWIQQSTVCV